MKQTWNLALESSGASRCMLHNDLVAFSITFWIYCVFINWWTLLLLISNVKRRSNLRTPVSSDCPSPHFPHTRMTLCIIFFESLLYLERLSNLKSICNQHLLFAAFKLLNVNQLAEDTRTPLLKNSHFLWWTNVWKSLKH